MAYILVPSIQLAKGEGGRNVLEDWRRQLRARIGFACHCKRGNGDTPMRLKLIWRT